MHKITSISAVSLFLLPSFAWPQAPQTPVTTREPSVAVGSHGVVVSGKAAATAAGIKILEQGGNAADAGAATLLALSVTYVGAFCVGGEIPILVYSADHENVKLLEGQGEAPRDPKAIAWYMEHGIPDGDVKAAAVPGTIDAVVTLLKLYGTKSFEEVVQPTLAILDAGGPSWYIDTGSGKRIEATPAAPISATVPQAWHSPQRPTHLTVDQPHSEQRWPGERVIALVAIWMTLRGAPDRHHGTLQAALVPKAGGWR